MDKQAIGGRYELERRIGVGGMARVYLARDRLLGRDVAVKVLNADSASDPVFVERFRREAQSAAALNHPNIVSIYDTGFAEDGSGDFVYYIVMEFVPGSNLKETAALHGPLPEAEALRIAESIAAALEPAHRRGIVHRDVKPHNVILDPDGHVKVADFGIARAEGLSQLTKTNAVTGTVHYISPEQAQRRPVDGRSDLYSLGVVLYELLTGRLPFEGESQVEIALQHVSEKPPSPREINPSISEMTDAVVMRALSKDPADRFQSAAEMRATLAEARARIPGPTRAAPPTLAAGAALGEATERVMSPIGRQSMGRAGEHREPTGSLASERTAGRRGERWLIGLPVLLALLIVAGGLAVVHPWQSSRRPGPQAAGVKVTATPRRAPPTRAAATRPFPAPSHTPSRPPALAPAPQAVPTSTPASQAVAPPAPTFAASAPTSAPTARAQSVAVSGGESAPLQAVQSFYSDVASGQLDQAAALWDDNMRSSCPLSQCIYGRFSNSQISLAQAHVVSQSGNQATVKVVVAETRGGSTITWAGNWYLRRASSGWVLDAEDLRQV